MITIVSRFFNTFFEIVYEEFHCRTFCRRMLSIEKKFSNKSQILRFDNRKYQISNHWYYQSKFVFNNSQAHSNKTWTIHREKQIISILNSESIWVQKSCDFLEKIFKLLFSFVFKHSRESFKNFLLSNYQFVSSKLIFLEKFFSLMISTDFVD